MVSDLASPRLAKTDLPEDAINPAPWANVTTRAISERAHADEKLPHLWRVVAIVAGLLLGWAVPIALATRLI